VPAPVEPVLSGTISFSGTAKDYPTVAAWMDDMSKVPDFTDVYVSTAQRTADASTGAGRGLTFSATAVVAPAAVSHRVDQFTKAGS